jgi:hypothetical protein
MKIQDGLASNVAAQFAFTKAIAAFVEEKNSSVDLQHHQGPVHGRVQGQ